MTNKSFLVQFRFPKKEILSGSDRECHRCVSRLPNEDDNRFWILVTLYQTSYPVLLGIFCHLCLFVSLSLCHFVSLSLCLSISLSLPSISSFNLYPISLYLFLYLSISPFYLSPLSVYLFPLSFYLSLPLPPPPSLFPDKIIVMVLQWTPLNGITLGQTISDPFNRKIPITEHMSYKKAIGRYSGLDQSESFWSHYPNDPFNRDPIKRRPLY